MNRGRVVPIVVLTLCIGASAPAADVQVNIGIPAAPQVLAVPQPFVAVPDVPAVRYAPENPLDVFLYDDRYYAWQDGWFVTPRPGDPWVYVEPERVPRTVLLVPDRYYKRVPPGHAKHAGQHHGKGKGHNKHDDGKGKGKGHKKHDD